VSLRNIIKAIRMPSSSWSLGALLVAGAAAGAIAVSTFNFVIHETSSDAFCLLCHANDIQPEYEGTTHHTNRLGLRVTCENCHIPREFGPKLIKKVTSGTKDVFYHILGKIDTLEKFEAHRMEMAMTTWEEMNASDSRECRHCHDQSNWGDGVQSEKARKFHAPALSNGKTCIDCHKGVAHKLPDGIGEDHQIEGIDIQ
jgi:cytochrome c-type protein NapC